MSDGDQSWQEAQANLKPSKLSLISSALGWFGVFLFWAFPFWLSMAAVVTGMIALNGVKYKGKGGFAQAKIGIISGFVGLALWLSLVIWVNLFLR